LREVWYVGGAIPEFGREESSKALSVLLLKIGNEGFFVCSGQRPPRGILRAVTPYIYIYERWPWESDYPERQFSRFAEESRVRSDLRGWGALGGVDAPRLRMLRPKWCRRQGTR
jgi:hypothetical protein